MTTIKLDYVPRPWQEQCHRTRRRFSVLVVHRRGGKTEVAIRELLNGALQCTRPLGIYGYIAPFRQQAKIIAWSRMKHILAPMIGAGMAEVYESDLQIRFPHNGAVIRLLGADNQDSIRGAYFDDVVLDEVAQMKPEVWHEVVEPMLVDRAGWAMFIGTVKGVDLLSHLYHQALERQKDGDEEWSTSLWTVYDTNSIDPKEVRRLERDVELGLTPESGWAREFLCDFTARGDDQLISVADTMAAVQRTYTPADVYHSAKVMGVDPARFGSDRSVIAMRQGLGLHNLVVMQGVDQMDLASRVAAEMHHWQPDAVFIDAGMGAGLIDRLRQLGHDVVEVPFGGKALKPKRFHNRRSEMWWEVREWIKAGGAIPDDLGLRQELATPTYKFTPTGQISLESKDDIRKRLPQAGSPDKADALALTFAAPVAPRQFSPSDAWPTTGVPGPRNRKSKRDWNPYSEQERRKRTERR